MRKDRETNDDGIMSFDSHCIKSIPVTVNGHKLPLEIGSKINVGDGLVRTVMKIQVNEEGDPLYGVQWIDGIDFKLDWMTFTELCIMSSCLKNKPKISL